MANECAPRCQISSKLVKRLQRCGDLTDFSKCQPSAPPSCICFELTGTTHDDYLVVSIVVQNVLEINAVVSIIFRLFGLQAPIQVPKIGVVGSPPKSGAILTKPQKAHPCASLRRLSHQAIESVDGSDL